MNWVDAVAWVIASVAALHGWRVGGLVGLSTGVGCLGGFFAGAAVTPFLADRTSGFVQVYVLLVATVGTSIALAMVGHRLGQRATTRVRATSGAWVDRVGGVLVGLATMALLVWLGGNVLSASRFETLSSGTANSTTLRALNRVLPPVPTVVSRLEAFLTERGVPVVFANLPPEVVGPATLPEDAAVRSAERIAGRSTIAIQAHGCGGVLYGSGFVAAAGLVVTNAHVIAGTDRVDVIDAVGTHPARAVLFDARLDLAILRAPDVRAGALKLYDGVVARHTQAAVLGYPAGGSLIASPAAVQTAVHAEGLDIYGATSTVRDIYQLSGNVRAGDSGGPLIAVGSDFGSQVQEGTVIGVVFARSTSDARVGYALTMPRVVAAVERIGTASATVGTGHCAP